MTSAHRAAGLCAATAAALASLLPAPAGAGLRYNASLGAGVEFADNANSASETPLETESPPVETSIATYLAGVELGWEQGGDSLDVAYLGRYRNVGEETPDVVSGWVHLGRAALQWRRWDPFYLEVTEERDRAAQYREEVDVDVPSRSDRNRLSARSGFEWPLGRTGRVEAGARGEWVSFPGTAGADESLALLGEIVVEDRWSPLLRGTLNAEYGLVRQELVPDHTAFEVGGELFRRLSPRVEVSASLSWRRESFEAAEEPGEGEAPVEDPGGTERDYLLKGLAVTGSIDGAGSWRLGYDDSTDRLADGTTVRVGRVSGEVSRTFRLGSRLRLAASHEDREFRGSGRRDRVWGPSVEARWVVTDWAAFDVRGSWTRTDRREEGTDPEEIDLTQVGPGVIVLLGERLQLEGGYRHRRNDAPLPEESYRSGTWYLMLSASLHPRQPGVFPESVAGQLGSLAQ